MRDELFFEGPRSNVRAFFHTSGRSALGWLLVRRSLMPLVALSRERSTEEYRQALADNAEELEQLVRMVNDLLFLAKAEHGESPLSRESVDLEAEAQRVCDFFEILAEERAIRLEVVGRLQLQAVRAALRRYFLKSTGQPGQSKHAKLIKL
ncbi:MAG: hypothetical protein HYZ18_01760 [Pseudogulbenkiania sp.]|nr:hypothetical protein [Pseudogulbenkiania sp.]